MTLLDAIVDINKCGGAVNEFDEGFVSTMKDPKYFGKASKLDVTKTAKRLTELPCMEFTDVGVRAGHRYSGVNPFLSRYARGGGSFINHIGTSRFTRQVP